MCRHNLARTDGSCVFPSAVMCTENEETVKNIKHRGQRDMARARLLYDTWPGRETRLSLRICVRSEAELAARAIAAKRIAARLHATERAFIPALAAPVLQTAAAQACALMPLCPMAWILLACLVALVGAFAACDWWPLAPHLHPSAAGHSGGTQPAAQTLPLSHWHQRRLQQTPQSKIAPPGIMGKGAEKLISAEDAAQVAEAVGRKRTSAC